MKKGKLVYCQETFQVFPSAKIAAEHHGMKKQVIYDHLNGATKTAKGKHFIYIENTADLSSFFAAKRQEVNEHKKVEKRLNKLLEAEQAARAQQADLAKQIAETRKMMRRM